MELVSFVVGVAACLVTMAALQWRHPSPSMAKEQPPINYDDPRPLFTNEASYWSQVIPEFKGKTRADRCQAFFDRIDHFQTHPNEDIDNANLAIYDLEALDQLPPKGVRLREVLKRVFYKNPERAASDDVDALEKEVQKTLIDWDAKKTQRLTDIVTAVRVYNHCYLGDKRKGDREIEKKVYPWLTGKWPTFQLLDGEVTSRAAVEGDFWGSYRAEFSGQGIVLTTTNYQQWDVVPLLYNLRMLNTTLPVQIVHYDDISPSFHAKLVAAARDPIPVEGYPVRPLELWFVNVSPAVAPGWRHKFNVFGNKFLAVLFATFADTLFVDSDLMVFERPESFFETEKYKRTGALFFQDRITPWKLDIRETDLIHSLVPSQSEEKWFGIAPVTNHTTDNRWFHFGARERQESGVLAIDRSGWHLSSLLMATQLFFHARVQHKMHGDKECFWLGFSINGDEKYAFNGHGGAAIGSWNPQGDQVCSVQVAHINDEDDRLLFSNGGALVKGKVTSEGFGQHYSKRGSLYAWTESESALENHSQQGLDPEVALIPPNEWLRGHETDATLEGWHMNEAFNSMWCGRLDIGITSNGAAIKGRVFELSPENKALAQALGRLASDQNRQYQEHKEFEETWRAYEAIKRREKIEI
ncbi:putative alpha-1,3-mannosyltransferase Mnn14p [Diutina catenulata]